MKSRFAPPVCTACVPISEPEVTYGSESRATDFTRIANMARSRFRKLLAAAGIRSIRLCDLRHTAATLAVAAGVSVKVISDQLGHASISFTLERYSHLLPSIQDEAAARVERMLMGTLASIRS